MPLQWVLLQSLLDSVGEKMRSYGPAIILSVLGHAALISFILWGLPKEAPKKQVKTPSYVKATLVELKPKVKPKPVSPPKKVVKPPKKKDDQRKKALDKKKQQRIAEQKKQKKLAEQKRKNQLAKKKAEDDKKKREAQKKKEEKRQEEKRKQEELERQQQAELERQTLVKALAEERARLDVQKQAAEDAEIVQSYVALIAQRVEQNWSRPPSARNGMEVVLRIQLVPTGQVINVDVVSGSGDSAFDRSAERAVKKAERFPELKDIPIRVFEQQFRVLNFSFSPEDLRQ